VCGEKEKEVGGYSGDGRTGFNPELSRVRAARTGAVEVGSYGGENLKEREYEAEQWIAVRKRQLTAMMKSSKILFPLLNGCRQRAG